MKVLVDTNVVLDVLLNRLPFFNDSRAIFDLAEQKQIAGFITASSMTDIFYLTLKKYKNAANVYIALDDLMAVYSIAPVSETVIAEALSLRWRDFEDAVQYLAAKEKGVDYIITRNKQDFESDAIPCLNPAEFIALFDKEA